MASSMHVISVSHNQYVNVSNGNLNCILMVKHFERIRIHVGGEEPKAATDLWFSAQRSMDDPYEGYRVAAQFINLEAETDVWVRSEINPINIMVIRGETTIT